MNKKTIRIAGWALGLSMVVAGIGTVVGASQKAPVETKATETAQTITWSSFSGSNTYGFPTTQVSDAADYEDETHGMTIAGKNLKVNSGYLMLYGATGYLYNKDPIDGYITSVSVKFNTGSVSTAAICAIGLGTSSGDSLSGASKNTTQSAGGTATNASGVTVSNKYRYFSIDSTKSGKNLQITQISVTYEPIYTVTYDKNDEGASGTISDLNSPYLVGSTVTVLDNSFSAPTGYIFDSWNTSSDGSGTKYVSGNTFSITANTILYAQWAEIGDEPYVISDSSASGFTGQKPSIGFSFGNFNSGLTAESSDSSIFTVGTINTADPANSTISLNYLAEGDASLYIKDGDVTIKTIDIEVNQTTITGMPSSATVHIGDTLDLGSLVSANIGTLTWTTSSEEKAIVSDSGIVTPVALGSAIITVTSDVDDRVNSSCTVTVAKALQVVTDELTRGDLDFGDSTGYSDFVASDTSSAIYVGQAYQTAASFMQIRTSGSKEGIVTTRRGGKNVKSVTLDFNKSSANIEIYGSNTPYSGTNAAQLFSGSTAGTKLTTISYSADPVEYDLEGEYKYLGIRSSSGAAYLDSISIVWNLYESDEVAAEIKTMAGGWTNNVSTGSCGDNYSAAKEMILLMSSDELNLFKTSENPEIASARETYQHWCSVNGDDSPWAGDIVSAGAYTVPLTIGNSNELLPIILVGASICFAAVGGTFILARRRKED